MTLALVANAGDGTISTFDLSGGRLNRLAVSPAGRGVGTFAVDASRSLVFAGVKGASGDEDGPALVLTMRLDRSTGELTEVSRREADASITYLDLTPDGTRLLGASYGGGFGCCWPVSGDGVLGESPNRIEHPNLHCVVAADDDSAYFVSLGADRVVQCAVNADGLLTEGPVAAAPPGSGPRHLVLDSSGRNAYVITEFSGEVLRYRRGDDNALTLAGTVSIIDASAGLTHSRFGADPRAEHLIWGADLHLSDDGASLWATERTAGTIATVRLDGDGALGEVTAVIATEPQPRGFGVTGDLVLVTGELSTTVTWYRAAADGTLTPLDRAETGAGANWVRFIDA